mgnify:CR=1 FL=1
MLNTTRSDSLCAECGKPHNGKFARLTKHDDRRICYSCCAEYDKKEMVNTGKFVGYLTRKPPIDSIGHKKTELLGFEKGRFGNLRSEEWSFGNWPGSLTFKVQGVERHRVNGLERERITFRFIGPDGKVWRGVKKGINHDIARAYRTKLRNIRQNW